MNTKLSSKIQIISEFKECEPEFSSSFEKEKSKKQFISAIFKSLKPFIHLYGVGAKLPTKNGIAPRPIITKQMWEDYYNDGSRINMIRIFKHKFNRQQILKNQNGENHYYTSNTSLALIMMDIDAPNHKEIKEQGRKPYEWELADAIKTSIWLNSVFSDLFNDGHNDTGKHGFFKLAVNNRIEEARELLKRLEVVLNDLKPTQSVIEIKGTMRSKRNCGTLGRIPVVNDQKQLDQFNELPTISLEELEARIQKLESITVVKPRKVIVSERSCRIDFPDVDIAYKRVIRTNCPRKVGELRIAELDYKVLLEVCKFMYEHPNEDNSAPVMRLEALWNERRRQLAEEGITIHAWNYHRIKACLDFLEKQGFKVIIDARYYVGKNNDGKATQWYIDFQQIEEEEKEAVSSLKVAIHIYVRVTYEQYWNINLDDEFDRIFNKWQPSDGELI